MQLKNIIGYWSLVSDSEGQEIDFWQGQILHNDNGWFEGIIESGCPFESPRFIFGVYHEGMGIRLFTLMDNYGNLPFAFQAEDMSADGTSESFYLKHENESMQVTVDATPCTSPEQIDAILKSIDDAKKDSVSHPGMAFYNNAYNMQDALSASVLDNSDASKRERKFNQKDRK